MAVALGGCSTTYQKSGFSGGFSETQIQPDVFTVRFKGNGYTGAERASDFCLLRCAELAIEHGYKNFAVVDSSSHYKTTVSSNGPTTTTGTLQTYGNTTHGTFNTHGGGTTTWNKPRSTRTIRLLKRNEKGSFDANFIRNSIRTKYKIKQNPSEDDSPPQKGQKQGKPHALR